MRMLHSWLLLILGVTSSAWGGAAELQQSMQRLEERLREHREDGLIDASQFTPLTIAGVISDQDNRAHIISLLSNSLQQSLQAKVLVCERCMSAVIESGDQTVYENDLADVSKIRSIYQRETARPQAAVWFQSSAQLLSIRIVSLATGEIIYADTVDSRVDWPSRSMRTFTKSRLLERQARGEAILHTQWDFGISPAGGGSHIGWSMMQQWGSSNQYLSGISLNITDPVLGFGVNWFRIMPALRNTALGGKVLVSVPRLLTRAAESEDSEDGAIKDNLLTVVGMAKLPLFGPPEKFYAHIFFSTNGLFGLGLTF